MPRTNINPQQVPITGLLDATVFTDSTSPAVDAVNGNKTPNTNGTVRFRVYNGSGATRTFTVLRQVNLSDDNGTLQAPRTFSIAAGKVFYSGPFSGAIYNNGSSEIEWSLNDATDCTVEIIYS